ncbi:MAG: hypothetical protein LBB89_00890 [Treponema sp.]|nr:hypothetical protein [Treponema sp.]
MHKTSGGSRNFTAQEPPLELLTITFSGIGVYTTIFLAPNKIALIYEIAVIFLGTAFTTAATATAIIALASKHNQSASHQ